MGTKKQKTRADIDPKYKWALERLYADHEAWEQDFAKIPALTDAVAAYEGKVTESAASLLGVLKANDDLQRLFSKLMCFAMQRQDEDTRVATYQEMFGRGMSAIAASSARTSFCTPELIAAPEEKIWGFFAEEPELEVYRFMVEGILKEKKHVLSAVEENLIAQFSEITEDAHNIFSMLNNADLTFGKIKDENGEEVALTHGNYVSFLENRDRSVREAAFTRLYETFKAHINTLGATYASSVKGDCLTARIRHYDSSLSAALSGDEIPESVYSNLIDAVHEFLPELHRYMALRKKWLGLDEMKMFDVYMPVVEVPERVVPFEEAVGIMQEALAPLGEDYVKTAVDGALNGWIDVYETEGKRSGAYSNGCYDSDPYILLNYNDKLQDVLTLVHEMGHSMHTWHTNHTQPFCYSGYTIFVAEVASTVNENLLLRHWLKNETDKEMKKYLLNRFLEEFRGTVFRQTMFAEFELLTHRYVEGGGALTPEWLCKEYDRLNTLYFGDAIAHDDLIQYEWARIPHFYSAYYVYQYATGFSAATALANRILSEGAPAVADYRKFLSMGSSAYPVDELKVAGVDMSKKESVEAALEIFRGLLDELEALMEA